MAEINWAEYGPFYPTDPSFYFNAGYLPEHKWFDYPWQIWGSGVGSGDEDKPDKPGNGGGKAGRALDSMIARNLFRDRSQDMGIGSIGTEVRNAPVMGTDPYKAAAQMSGPWGRGIGALTSFMDPGVGIAKMLGQGIAQAGYGYHTPTVDPRMQVAAMNNSTQYGAGGFAQQIRDVVAENKLKNQLMGISDGSFMGDLGALARGIGAAGNPAAAHGSNLPGGPVAQGIRALMERYGTSGMGQMPNPARPLSPSKLLEAFTYATRGGPITQDRNNDRGPQTAGGRDMNSPGEQAAARGEFGVQHGW